MLFYFAISCLLASALVRGDDAHHNELKARSAVDVLPLPMGSSSSSSVSLKICGNYCGPGWCSQNYIDETLCVQRRVWGGPSDGSPIDACCKLHDYCCGKGSNRASCNQALVNCATPCTGVCANAVWAYMKFHTSFCCGTTCSSSLIAQIEAINNITITREMLPADFKQ
jgi:hypothetical protein